RRESGLGLYRTGPSERRDSKNDETQKQLHTHSPCKRQRTPPLVLIGHFRRYERSEKARFMRERARSATTSTRKSKTPRPNGARRSEFPAGDGKITLPCRPS